ncbi:MAG: hypothetical protein US92_C0001G0193 [Candidatus Peregrinibacteria bacterium GW2011_GWA2_38_36]|nr:MAG: hypothetical protein US92_C0001G0193 [Candidatus Peregrinibacteria bacterium GW2011_GWA2_38_36]
MSIFQIQVLVSFLVGGIVIAMQTLIGERLNAYWRGVVLALPITCALGVFFTGLATTTADAVRVATVVPAALFSDFFFVGVFAALSSFGLVTALFGGFLAFFVSAFFIILYPPSTFLISVLYGLPGIIIPYLVVRKLPQVDKFKVYPMNAKHILLRGLLGGSVIAIILILSKTLGNVWGGVASAFPIIFTSMFIIYYLLQGKSVIPSVAKSVFFPGALVYILHMYIAVLTFEKYGIWLGTLFAYIAVFVFLLAWSWGRRHFWSSSSKV